MGLSFTGGDSTHNRSGSRYGFIAFEHDSYSIDEDAATLVVHVRRFGGSEGAITATFATQDVTAVAGLDYLYGEWLSYHFELFAQYFLN